MIKRKNWINKVCSILSNVLRIVLGIIAIVSPETFSASLGLFAGSFMICIGALLILFALFSVSILLGSGFLALEGVLTTCIGIFLVSYKDASLAIITIVLAFYFLFSGISKIVTSIDLRKFRARTWWVTLTIGIIYVILSIVLFSFNNANEIVSILLGVFFILSGVFGMLELFDGFKREKRETTILHNIDKNADNLDHIDIDFTKED